MANKKPAAYMPPSLVSNWMEEEGEEREERAPRASSAPLAMVYINKQGWDETYEPEAGFTRGTIFPQLDKPFMGKGACGRDRTR